MAYVKGKTLETVVEDLEEEKGDLNTKSKRKNTKKIGGLKLNNTDKTKLERNTKTRKVIIDVPTDNDNKGTHSLNEIKSKNLSEMADNSENMKVQQTVTEIELRTEEKTNTNDVYIKTPNVDKFVSKNIVENDSKEEVSANQENDKNAINGKSDVDQIYNEFTRTDTCISLQSTQNDIKLARNEHKSTKKFIRPKSTNGFSKKDMEMFLPRKSFFSSHDKVLKDAGFHVDSNQERKKPNWRVILRMHTMEELYPVEKETENEMKKSVFAETESDHEEDGYSLENVETSMSMDNSGIQHKRRPRKTGKNANASEKEDYKPLLDYLKYIHENPDEYIHMAKFTSKNMDYRHPSRMVRMGRVYRRGHHGVVRNSIYMHALSGLKPKLTEPAIQRPLRAGDKGGKKDQPTEGAEQTSGNTATADESSEIEKLKSKTEKWMRGLTTVQLMKAKEYALKDVGEEDTNVTKWWHAFKTCHYLRVPKYVEDNITA